MLGITTANMMKLLPFTALRTLEAVVRLRGFGRAAEELNVTQSAVSQHIKSLEEWTGHKLLLRGARKTVATEKGLRLASAVAEGYGGVEAVCDELRDKHQTANRGVLVASPPGFGFVWLLPRLMNFDQDFPDFPVSLSTDIFARDVGAEDTDVMIQYGAGGFSGLHSELLMQETITPVCSPKIAAELHEIADLNRFTILKDNVQNFGTPPTWDYWAQQADIKLPNLPRIRKFGQANMVVQAAVKGLGIAMGRTPLICDAIAEGTLVCPFPQVVKSQFSYWFVCRHEALQLESVQAFRAWLHQEVKEQITKPSNVG